MSVVIEALRQIRKSKKISQYSLSEKLGLPQSHLSTIESGKTDPRLSTVQDLARLLNHELMLVPLDLLSTVRSLIANKPLSQQQPAFRPDDELDEEND